MNVFFDPLGPDNRAALHPTLCLGPSLVLLLLADAGSGPIGRTPGRTRLTSLDTNPTQVDCLQESDSTNWGHVKLTARIPIMLITYHEDFILNIILGFRNVLKLAFLSNLVSFVYFKPYY